MGHGRGDLPMPHDQTNKKRYKKDKNQQDTLWGRATNDIINQSKQYRYDSKRHCSNGLRIWDGRQQNR